MTNKAGARRAQENLYVARQQTAAAAPGRRNAEAMQRALQAKAREARAVAAAKKAAAAAAVKVTPPPISDPPSADADAASTKAKAPS